MTLKTHMKRQGWSLSKAAKLFGCSKSYVGFLVSGERIPSLTMAQRIEKQTGGKVTPNDWKRRAA